MPPLPMLMSPLRYAVTRKSRAISALASPPRESFVSASTKLARTEPYCSISVSFSLALKSLTDRRATGRINRGTGKRYESDDNKTSGRENTTCRAHILRAISATNSTSPV